MLEKAIDASPGSGVSCLSQVRDQASTAGSIYEELADHQRTEPWHGQPMIELLQTWAERFIAEFKLDVPEVVIGIEKLASTRYGQFRMGHNRLGLRGEITLNARYLNGKRPLWEILGTLLHELVHAWQQAHGSPSKNHHNDEFRKKAAQLGLMINKKGLTGYAAIGPFKALLARFCVEAPAVETPIPEQRPRGSSKQRKWSCSCPINVRCAVDLQAQCLWCGDVFTLCEGPSVQTGRTELQAG